ncbi:MAG: hypothetical protein NZ822_00620 [Patescibacteria group bacterium]|nr:hypothetical protein [Patescibacteria group bacterium]
MEKAIKIGMAILAILLGAILGIESASPQATPRPRLPARPPENPIQAVEDVSAPESDFFFGPVVYYSQEKPEWVFPVRPLVIGLVKGRGWNTQEIIIEEELRRFAKSFTRNVLVIHASPWEARDKFKKEIAVDPRFRWLWVEASFDSFSLASFCCFEPLCFNGSQARLWVRVEEINPNDTQTYLLKAGYGHYKGHIHAWGRNLWLSAGAPPGENLFYFTQRMLLRSHLNSFANELKPMLR